MNKQRWISALGLLLIIAFFGWRYVSLSLWFHLVLLAGFVLALGLVLAGRFSKKAQANTLNLGISVVFLDLVFAQIPLAEVGESLLRANWWMMIPSLVALMIHLVFRIWRWQWLLRPIADIPFGPAWRAGMIGIGGNMILPARAGEFLRAYALGRSTGISKTGAFATVVVERIFDGLTVVLFLIILIIFGVRDPQLQQYGLIFGAFFVLAMVGMVVFMFNQTWFEKILSRILPEAIRERVLDLLRAFATGLGSLRDWRQLVVVSIQSIIAWIFVVLSFWPVMLAFDFHAPVPFFAAILTVPMVAFGLTIPAAPGGLGIFELAAVLALEISFNVLGDPLPEAMGARVAAYAVLLRISQAVPEAIIGVWCFFAEGLTVADLDAGRKLDEPAPDGSSV